MTTVTRTHLHRAALAYAERFNIPVHRLAPRSKIPPKGSHGHLDATKDVDQIDAWWTEEPRCNIGMPTGAASGVVVVEVDPRNGGDETLRDLEGEFGSLPETPRVLSGRGDGGTHYWLKHPGGYVKCSSGEIGPGVDVKGDGGAAVIPPSIHPATGQQYRWDAGAHIDDTPIAEMPDWLRAKLTEVKPRPAAPVSDDWTIPDGQRNKSLTSIAGRLRRQGHSEREIEALLQVANQDRCKPPLPEAKVSAIAASVGRYPPSEVPDFSEEAEETARRESERLRTVISARHDFVARARLTATQKDAALTIGRLLPSLPKNDNGEVQLCSAYIAPQAGCSRGTVLTLRDKLAEAGVWSVRQKPEIRNGRPETVSYVRLAEGIPVAEVAFLDAVAQAPIQQKPRGGYRTKTICLKPVQAEDLLCPEHGDAGARTLAVTYCLHPECAGAAEDGVIRGAIHDHDPVYHKAGWLSEDPADDPDEATEFKFERGNGSPSDAIEPNGADPANPSFDSVKGAPEASGAQSLTYKNPGTYAPISDTCLADDPQPPPRTCADCGDPLSPERRLLCEPCAVAGGALPLLRRPGLRPGEEVTSWGG